MAENHEIEPRKKAEVKFDGGEPTRNRKIYSPETDIVDTGSEIMVISDMPGVDERSVEVTLDKNILTISSFPPVEQVEKYSLTYAEYGVGDFERKFVISQDVDRERIEAKVKDGVLYLHLPKSGPAKSRKIEVKAM